MDKAGSKPHLNKSRNKETNMTQPFATTSKLAYQVPRGHAVRRPDSDILYFKAERKGTDYIHHYLIQVTPAFEGELALVYIDPEEPLFDSGEMPVFHLESGDAHQSPDTGCMFSNTKGIYLKVADDPKAQKMFAYIDISTGEVCRRQERNIKEVFKGWSVKIA